MIRSLTVAALLGLCDNYLIISDHGRRGGLWLIEPRMNADEQTTEARRHRELGTGRENKNVFQKNRLKPIFQVLADEGSREI